MYILAVLKNIAFLFHKAILPHSSPISELTAMHGKEKTSLYEDIYL